MAKIKGGYYIKAKCIQQSDIANAPPHVREIWDWFLMKANYRDGERLKRGQLLTSYKEIQEGLCWYIGYRKCKYSKSQCENAMKWLKKATMVTTTRTTRGMIVTILNYDRYQRIENYESHNETYTRATTMPQWHDTIQKEDKNNIKKNILSSACTEIISHLNEKTGKNFKANTKTTTSLINGRMNDGFSVEDFKTVIDNKTSEWLGSAEYEKYLCPDTLFRPSKFEKYLNQKPKPKKLAPDWW